MVSSGELTSEADRATIARIEEEVRSTYVRSATLTEKARIEGSSKKRRTFTLSGKQVRDADVTYLSEVLASETVAQYLSTLRLDGNLLTASGVGTLCETLVCAADITALRELSLADNPRLLLPGVAELAKWMPHSHFGLSTLRLAGCTLESPAGIALAAAIPQCASLTHVDLRRNLLDDAAVEALLTACTPPQASGGVEQVLRVTIDVEGNPMVSAALFGKVSVLCGMYS